MELCVLGYLGGSLILFRGYLGVIHLYYLELKRSFCTYEFYFLTLFSLRIIIILEWGKKKYLLQPLFEELFY